MRPKYPLLNTLRGFLYCDLLLAECESLAWNLQPAPAASRTAALSRCRKVRERSAQTLEWAKQQRILLDIALNRLTLGRTFLLKLALDGPSLDLFSSARNHLDQAVADLLQARQQQYQPLGLIARAQLHRVQFQHSGDQSFAQQAQQALDEAAQIASRGPMPLFQADILLERSRLHHAQGHLDQARQSLSQARTLIQKHGYHRRDPEVKALEEQLK